MDARLGLVQTAHDAKLEHDSQDSHLPSVRGRFRTLRSRLQGHARFKQTALVGYLGSEVHQSSVETSGQG